MRDKTHIILKMYPLPQGLTDQAQRRTLIDDMIFYPIGFALVEDHQLATVFYNGCTQYKIMTEDDFKRRRAIREIGELLKKDNSKD